MNKLTTLQIFFSLISTSCAIGGCGQTLFSRSSGSISFSTSTAITCTYNIQVSNRVVELKWKLFRIPGKMPSCGTNQYLKVYLGCLYSSTYLTSFCSSNMDGLPHNIYAQDGCIKIVVKTQGSANFVASYTSKSSGSYFSYPSTCSSLKTVRSASGVVASPNWPNYYQDGNFPPGLFSGDSCDWQIDLLDSKKLIKLSFMDVDIYSDSSSCRSNEFLSVKGEKSVLTVVKEERKYCRKKPFSLTTKYYELFVEMTIYGARSSSSFKNRGFVVGWVSYEADNDQSATRLSSTSGSLSFLTSKAKKHSYVIEVPNRVVELKWDQFKIPGKMPSCGTNEYLKVYLGCVSSTYFTSFCSSNMDEKPHNIYARDGCIKIEVEVQGSAYFEATYTSKRQDETYFPMSKCQRSTNRYSSSGTISSPNWPQPYTRSSFPSSFSGDRECEWNIKLHDTRKLLKINVMDIDIYRYNMFQSSCRSDERLKFKGKKSLSTTYKQSKTFCYERPFSLVTKYYDVEFEMEIDRYRPSGYTNRGFVLGWVAYTDDEAAEKTFNFTLIICGGVFIVVLCIILICISRFPKRRNAAQKRAATMAAQPMLHTNVPYSQQTASMPFQQPQQAQMPGYPQQAPMSGYPQQPTTNYTNTVPVYPPQQPGYPPVGVGYPPPQPYPTQPAYAPQSYPPLPAHPVNDSTNAVYPNDSQAPLPNQLPPPYPGKD